MSDHKFEAQSDQQQATDALLLVRQRHEQELQIERENMQHAVALAQVEADRETALLRIQQAVPQSSRISGSLPSTNLTLQELDKKIAASQTAIEAESWIEVKKNYQSQEQEQSKQLQRLEEERKENQFRRVISGVTIIGGTGLVVAGAVTTAGLTLVLPGFFIACAGLVNASPASDKFVNKHFRKLLSSLTGSKTKDESNSNEDTPKAP